LITLHFAAVYAAFMPLFDAATIARCRWFAMLAFSYHDFAPAIFSPFSFAIFAFLHISPPADAY